MAARRAGASSLLELVKLFVEHGGCPADCRRHEVAVDLGGEVDVAVAHPPAHLGQRQPGMQRDTGVGVPQVMGREVAGESGCPGGAAEGAAERVGSRLSAGEFGEQVPVLRDAVSPGVVADLLRDVAREGDIAVLARLACLQRSAGAVPQDLLLGAQCLAADGVGADGEGLGYFSARSPASARRRAPIPEAGRWSGPRADPGWPW